MKGSIEGWRRKRNEIMAERERKRESRKMLADC